MRMAVIHKIPCNKNLPPILTLPSMASRQPLLRRLKRLLLVLYLLHNPHGRGECRYCRSKYLSMQSWISAQICREQICINPKGIRQDSLM
jgi:hypothetical protein